MSVNHVFDDNGIYFKNLANTGDKYGINQYCFPHSYELVGKEFKINADKEYVVNFLNRHFALFNGEKVGFEAEKLENAMYLVRLGATVLALDLLNNQAVFAFECGAVVPGALNGAEAPKLIGDDMVGTNVRWVLGVNRYIRQEFVSETTVKTAWTPSLERVQENAYKAVKLRDSFFFVAAESGDLKNADAPFFTHRVVLLEDYERCMAAGCVLGHGFDPIMVCGYARFEDQ